MRLAEFDVEREWWVNRQESEQSWKVSAEDIAKNNFNLDIKNPNTPVEVHDDPDLLLMQYKESLQSVSELQNKLRKQLEEMLGK
jgi:type I restriction enzyme M protein